MQLDIVYLLVFAFIFTPHQYVYIFMHPDLPFTRWPQSKFHRNVTTVHEIRPILPIVTICQKHWILYHPRIFPISQIHTPNNNNKSVAITRLYYNSLYRRIAEMREKHGSSSRSYRIPNSEFESDASAASIHWRGGKKKTWRTHKQYNYIII